jgi:hypothetical protein
LVAKTHLENPQNLPMVNHKNFDRTDNKVENLEWSSYGDNMIHFGVKNCKSVQKLDSDGNMIQTYDSISQASTENNIGDTGIVNACKGNQKTAGGFKWKYNDNNLCEKFASPV